MKRLAVLLLALCIADVASAAVAATDAKELLIPVAGHAAGAHGELFVTDLVLVNLSSTSQQIELVWLPRGGTDAPLTRRVTLEKLRFWPIEDVVAKLFETEGVGAILIRLATAPGVPQDTALIDAHARIWTQQRETRGTLTQSVPGVLLEGWKESTPAYVHGVRNDSLFRGNYGIVNLSPEPRQFLVIANGNHGKGQEVVTVPGNGVLHKAMPPLAAGDLSIHFEPLDGSGRWHAYSSSVDNLSGSSWTIPAMQPKFDLQY